MASVRVALFGTPGAGKSTCSHLIELTCEDRMIAFERVRLADPLYECQAAIYAIAGRPLVERHSQDGELLNFLGTHLRKINPSVLVDRFRQRVSVIAGALDEQPGGPSMIVCDDMRAADAPALRTMGFVFVRIVAHPALCQERRRTRGDVFLGSDSHETEQGLDHIECYRTVANEATLDDLRSRLTALVEELIP